MSPMRSGGRAGPEKTKRLLSISSIRPVIVRGGPIFKNKTEIYHKYKEFENGKAINQKCYPYR